MSRHMQRGMPLGARLLPGVDLRLWFLVACCFAVAGVVVISALFLMLR